MEELKHCFCPGQQYVGCFLYQLCNISTCAYTYNHFFYLFLLDWCMNQLLSFSHMSNRFFVYTFFISIDALISLCFVLRSIPFRFVVVPLRSSTLLFCTSHQSVSGGSLNQETFAYPRRVFPCISL